MALAEYTWVNAEMDAPIKPLLVHNTSLVSKLPANLQQTSLQRWYGHCTANVSLWGCAWSALVSAGKTVRMKTRMFTSAALWATQQAACTNLCGEACGDACDGACGGALCKRVATQRGEHARAFARKGSKGGRMHDNSRQTGDKAAAWDNAAACSTMEGSRLRNVMHH
eukprot:6171895-Pleurochrysis_carterae.AAC.5